LIKKCDFGFFDMSLSFGSNGLAAMVATYLLLSLKLKNPNAMHWGYCVVVLRFLTHYFTGQLFVGFKRDIGYCQFVIFAFFI